MRRQASAAAPRDAALRAEQRARRALKRDAKGARRAAHKQRRQQQQGGAAAAAGEEFNAVVSAVAARRAVKDCARATTQVPGCGPWTTMVLVDPGARCQAIVSLASPPSDVRDPAARADKTPEALPSASPGPTFLREAESNRSRATFPLSATSMKPHDSRQLLPTPQRHIELPRRVTVGLLLLGSRSRSEPMRERAPA